jgi:glucose/arabinose dehydrogenase
MLTMTRIAFVLLTVLCTSACSATHEDLPFKVTVVAKLNEPWGMTFLPDGRLLVTEKSGRLLVVNREGDTSPAVKNVPEVAYRGQGGMGDVILHPGFSDNALVYISYAEAGDDGLSGAAVARGRLEWSGDTPALEGVEVIWRQQPKVSGNGHFGHRLAFDNQGYLFISSGERQKFDPAQDMDANLGKIVRLHDDGSVPDDNPFFDQGGVAAQVWTLGHRNPLGLAFDGQGRLWSSEMGPRDGDELNLVIRERNYGYPIVSEGNHYDGKPIPEHATRPEFEAPKVAWVPTVAPAGMVIYSGDLFPQWRGSALVAGLASQALIQVDIDGDTAREAARFNMGARIREVELDPQGAVWLLEDGDDGRLLKLEP